MARDDDEWIGTAEIATLLGCSRRLVQQSLADPARADRTYGNRNWRDRASPLGVKKIYQVRRSTVRRMAGH